MLTERREKQQERTETISDFGTCSVFCKFVINYGLTTCLDHDSSHNIIEWMQEFLLMNLVI